MRSLSALATALLIATACSDPAELDDRWEDPERIEFAASLDVDLATMTLTPSGLFWKELQPGEGDTAQVGAQIRLRSVVWLPDGSRVGEEIGQFPLGMGLAIRGIDEGAVGMRVGGIRQLVVRPSLAWGRAGLPTGGIPPLSTLVIELERLTSLAQ